MITYKLSPMCTYNNIHCTNLAVQANEQSVAVQANEQSVRTAVNRWRKDRVKLTADSEKRTQNLIMIMVLKKNTKKNKLMADFEKRTQNLIMIMVWKKSWRPTLKKEHKTWLWLWFWKNKNKKLTPTLKKEHKTWLWLWFWGKKFDGRLWKKNTKLDYDYGLKKIIKLTADFEKRTQNLVMIMVLKKKKKVDGRLKKPTKLDYDYGFEKKKSWQPTLKKTHKTWLWLWFWKRKKKLTANFEKKNTKLDYDYGFEKKIIKNVTADFEKRTLDYEVYGFEKKSVEKICAENYKGVQVSFFLGRDEFSDCPCIYTSQFHPSNFHRIMSESHCWNYWNWNSLSEYDNIDKVSTEHNITSTGVLWLKRIGEEKNC